MKTYANHMNGNRDKYEEEEKKSPREQSIKTHRNRKEYKDWRRKNISKFVQVMQTT